MNRRRFNSDDITEDFINACSEADIDPGVVSNILMSMFVDGKINIRREYNVSIPNHINPDEEDILISTARVYPADNDTDEIKCTHIDEGTGVSMYRIRNGRIVCQRCGDILGEVDIDNNDCYEPECDKKHHTMNRNVLLADECVDDHIITLADVDKLMPGEKIGMGISMSQEVYDDFVYECGEDSPQEVLRRLLYISDKNTISSYKDYDPKEKNIRKTTIRVPTPISNNFRGICNDLQIPVRQGVESLLIAFIEDEIDVVISDVKDRVKEILKEEI